MPRIDAGQEHQLAYRQRFNRPCRLLGCAALLAGVTMAVSPLLLAAAAGRAETVRAMAALGGLLMALGALLLFGRRGKLFDRAEGTITFWHGLGWSWRETVYDLRAFTILVIRPSLEPAGPWRLALSNAAGEQLVVFYLPSETAVRTAAGEIGGFLNLPIILAPPEPPATGPIERGAAFPGRVNQSADAQSSGGDNESADPLPATKQTA